jgi:hypothetical protein
MRLAAPLATALLLCACGSKKKEEKKEPPPPAARPDAGPPVKPSKPLGTLGTDPGSGDGKPQWAIPMGGLGSDVAREIATTPSGNVVVCGDFEDKTVFGPFGEKPVSGKSDAFVMVVDPAGKPVWMQTVGGGGEDTCNAVAVAPDGTIAIGGLFSEDLRSGELSAKSNGSDDLYVAGFTAEGKPTWLWVTGGNASDATLALAATADNAFIAGGGFYGTVDFGGESLKAQSYEDAFLVRLESGDVRWAKRFGGDRHDKIVRLAVDPQGSIIVGFQFEMISEIGGPPLESAGAYDFALAKLDPNGTHVWSHRYGGMDNDNILGIAIDAAGNIGIAGAFDRRFVIGKDEYRAAGEADALVARFDPEGTLLWINTFGAEREDVANGIAVDAAGNLVVAGWFSEKADLGPQTVASNGNKDAFIQKYAPDGTVRWVQTFGDRDHDKGHAAAVDAEGNVYVAGIFRFTMTLPIGSFDQVRDPEDKAPKSDMFVMRLDR